MKNVACIIARTNSSRLNKKVLFEYNGITLIEYIIKKIKRAQLVDEIYICTTTEMDDKILIDIADKNGVKSFAGSRDSVISRMLNVGEIEEADNLIRITGDNVFTDEVYLDLMIEKHFEKGADYTRTEFLPLGITAEVMNRNMLLDCNNSIDQNCSQYLLLYTFDPSKYKCLVLIPPKKHQKENWRISIDEKKDWEIVKNVLSKCEGIPNYDDIVDEIMKNNIDIERKQSKSKIKFPAGVKLYYEAARLEMKSRLNDSEQIIVSIDDYYNTASKHHYRDNGFKKHIKLTKMKQC